MHPSTYFTNNYSTLTMCQVLFKTVGGEGEFVVKGTKFQLYKINKS